MVVHSFADVAGRYVTELRDLNRRDRAVETAEGHVRTIAAYLGRKPIAGNTPEDIEAMRGDLLRPSGPGERARSGRTVLNYLNTLHAIFEYAVRHRYTRWNHVKAVAKPNVEQADDKEY